MSFSKRVGVSGALVQGDISGWFNTDKLEITHCSVLNDWLKQLLRLFTAFSKQHTHVTTIHVMLLLSASRAHLSRGVLYVTMCMCTCVCMLSLSLSLYIYIFMYIYIYIYIYVCVSPWSHIYTWMCCNGALVQGNLERCVSIDVLLWLFAICSFIVIVMSACVVGVFVVSRSGALVQRDLHNNDK